MRAKLAKKPMSSRELAKAIQAEFETMESLDEGVVKSQGYIITESEASECLNVLESLIKGLRRNGWNTSRAAFDTIQRYRRDTSGKAKDL